MGGLGPASLAVTPWPVMAWTLYYEDGSTFSDHDGAPHESPPWGVVSVLQHGHDPPIIVNADWLMWRSDLNEWTQCGGASFDDHASHYGHVITCWRKTRWIRNIDWKALWARMREDAADG